MPIASVHVNNRPLSGDWDGHHWDQQEHRYSNNIMSGPTPPIPPASAAGGLLWQVVGRDDPDSIVFKVLVDRPGDDEVLFTGVRNNTETSYLPAPTITDRGVDGTPFHNGQRWDEYYNRGIYIADVHGASGPFMINVVGVGSCNTMTGELVSPSIARMENVSPPPPCEIPGMPAPASAISSLVAMENMLPPPPTEVLGMPAPAPAVKDATQTLAPSLASVGANWKGSCAGGDSFPNNCAHFLSDAFIRAGYTELQSYGALLYIGKAAHSCSRNVVLV
jgi:hypothetical protein